MFALIYVFLDNSMTLEDSVELPMLTDDSISIPSDFIEIVIDLQKISPVFIILLWSTYRL